MIIKYHEIYQFASKNYTMHEIYMNYLLVYIHHHQEGNEVTMLIFIEERDDSKEAQACA